MADTLVEIWTDGASKGNPGPGGWGALLTYKQHRKELYGGSLLTTNNQMELTAAIEALKRLKWRCKVIIHTDSEYVQKGMTLWIANWQRKNWKRGEKPVKNAELWKSLLEESQKHDVDWVWVRGHNGDPGNEKADELANKGVEMVLK
ncbi:MAG: ribonuclease HI, partial [Burkholderiales bacterium]|nr:ribonuclease HI [Burkholderiales bacterium]